MSGHAASAGKDVAESVFVRIPEKARRHGAINLAQGVFDHGPEPALLRALSGTGDGTEHQYAPSPGHPELRAALAGHTERYAGARPDQDAEVTVTAGATEALYCTLSALLGPGDEAVLVEPAYESYAPVITAAGAAVRRVRSLDAGGRVDPAALAAAVTPATRVMVVNSPWNPLGTPLEPEIWDTLADLAGRHDLVVVSDETYEHLNLDGSAHPGVLAAVQDPEKRVKISSVSKTLAATGWRVGWAVAGPGLTRRIRARHQYVTFCPPTVLQLAAAEVLSGASFPRLVEERGARLAAKVGRFADRLAEAGLKCAVPRSGFYLLADVGENAEAWCDRAVVEARVAALPLSVFYSEPDAETASTVRFAVCKRESTLDEAARRLLDWRR